jgi:Skp family chaperone for outer membrane proteins
MNEKVAAEVAYLREKAAHFRRLAAKAKAELNPITERLEKLAADLEAKADKFARRGEPLGRGPAGDPAEE